MRDALLPCCEVWEQIIHLPEACPHNGRDAHAAWLVRGEEHCVCSRLPARRRRRLCSPLLQHIHLAAKERALRLVVGVGDYCFEAGGGPSTAAPNTCEACRRHPSASVRGRPAHSIKRERRTRDGARDRRAGMGGSGPAAGSAERGTAGEHGRTCLVSLPRPPLMLWAESRSQSLAACASAPALRPPAPAARPALRGPAARPAPRPRRADMPLPCSEILRRLRASSVVLVVLAQLIPPGSSHCQLQGDQV